VPYRLNDIPLAKPIISLIAAVADNGVIGANNALPWHLPADLRRFRELTRGHYVVMGRKTCDSLSRPLPERVNVVVSGNTRYNAPGFTVMRSLDAALEVACREQELFVIGGASLYAQVLPRADRFYLTLVHADAAGDTRFPDFNRNDWRELERSEHAADARHAHAYSFITMERRRER
jgi:dihydrofolate reductase